MNNNIYLRPGKEASLARFHPWIFSGAILRKDREPTEGDVVDVFSSKGDFLCKGHFQIGSIAVRVLTFDQEDIDDDFWRNRISEALQVRRNIGIISSSNTIYRLVHGEGDNLPGLIVDVYGRTAVVQAHSVGMHHARLKIARAIVEVLSDEIKNVFYKSEGTLPFKANLNAENGYLIENIEPESSAFENGLSFKIDWLKGQKTGFFVDQRENRSLLEKYSSSKRVLNMFCYTGGFSVYSMRGGAEVVHSVDSSEKAIMITDENIKNNFPNDSRHNSFAEDAFKYLRNIEKGEYDLIVLDPPAFAKHRDAVKNALQGYKKLNAVALEKIAPGGLIFTFSCSQVISMEQFRLAVFSASTIAKRKVRILHQLSQPADHPINIYHPEGEYLKGLVIYVE